MNPFNVIEGDALEAAPRAPGGNGARALPRSSERLQVLRRAAPVKPVTIKNFRRRRRKAKAGELVAPMRYVYDPEDRSPVLSNDWDRDERSIAAVDLTHRSTTSSRRPW